MKRKLSLKVLAIAIALDVLYTVGAFKIVAGSNGEFWLTSWGVFRWIFIESPIEICIFYIVLAPFASFFEKKKKLSRQTK
jgi:hypothetical protein